MNYTIEQQYFTMYIEECGNSKALKALTLKAYNIDLRQFADFLREREYMVSKEILMDYINFLHVSYTKPKTVKRKIATVNAFFNFLVFHDVIDTNPMLKIKTKFKEPKLLPRTIHVNDLNLIFHNIYEDLNHCDSEYQLKTATRNAAVIELLFSTGMRVSELCGLKNMDVNLAEKQIRILGKGSKERILYIGSDQVLDILRRYHALFVDQINVSDYFFINKLGNRLSEQSVRMLVHKYQKKLCITQHLTPHMFRHTFATQLLEEDVDVRYIQQILGHSSITTTQIYTHVTSTKQKEILMLKNPRNCIDNKS